MNIVIFIVILLVLVVVHEFGHFGVAKLAKVKVLEFGVGYPPKLWSFTRGETIYSVNLLPLGGFVRMLGEEDPTHPESFAARRALTRFAVLFAGPAMNAVLPIFLFTAVFMLPQDVVSTDVLVRRVDPGSPAEAAGVLPGDVIREAGGRELDNSADLQTVLQLRLAGDVEFVVERDGALVPLQIPEVRVDPPPGEGATGVLITDVRVSVATLDAGSGAAAAGLRAGDEFASIAGLRILHADSPQQAVAATLEAMPGEPIDVQVVRDGEIVALTLPASAGVLDRATFDVRPDASRSEPVWDAIPHAFRQAWDILVMFRNEISRWFAGSGAVQLSGPVGIAQLTGEVAAAGFSPILMWTALLSINLAILNLLPIPALDGGRITFVLLELVRGGRRLAPEKERLVHLVGFAVLMSAIIAISVQDVLRVIAGDSIIGP